MDHTVRVQLGEWGYDVVVGRVPDLGALIVGAVPGARRAGIVVDPAIARAAMPGVIAQVQRAGLEACPVNLDPGWLGTRSDGGATERLLTSGSGAWEGAKSLLTVEHICGQFADAGLDRRDMVLALGGGVMGDLAGFAAGIYRRGVRWVNAPTTLLSMVDAGVGGKTGANLFRRKGTLKNMVGVFHQPSLVVVTPAWLRTLPPREVRCGMAECIKHSLLCRSFDGFQDHELFGFTQGLVRRRVDLQVDDGAATELIARNVALKAGVVAGDERETAGDEEGGRALLNLGHTFGHVIEGLAGMGVLHGEAVGLGLVAASHAAMAMGRVGAGYVRAVEELVGGVGLATSLRGMPETPGLLQRMLDDKKTLHGRLRLILPFEPSPGVVGHASVVADPPASAVTAGWDAVRA